MTIRLISSAAGQALHKPYPEKRAVSTNRQRIRAAKVRTRDRKPEINPLEKAVKSPEPKLL